jgi:ribosome-associated toxin RatA of RatAB toxin-antitoxin module
MSQLSSSSRSTAGGTTVALELDATLMAIRVQQRLWYASYPMAVAMMAWLIGATGLQAQTMAPLSQPELTVREDHGVYAVTARFVVSETPSAALAVLTDYERIPRFMPGIESSVVLERSPGRVLVAQEAVSHLMLFSKRVHLVLEIVEAHGILRFRDRSGQSFARYEGRWQVCEESGGTSISYELTAQPAFSVPEFLLRRLLKRDSAQMIESLRREIGSRARQPAADSPREE